MHKSRTKATAEVFLRYLDVIVVLWVQLNILKRYARFVMNIAQEKLGEDGA